MDNQSITEKDLQILKLELTNQTYKEIIAVKSYLLTRLGGLILGGFSIIGLLGWLK